MKNYRKNFQSWAVLAVGIMILSCAENDLAPRENSILMQTGISVKEMDDIKMQTRGNNIATLPQKFTVKCDNGVEFQGLAATTNFIPPHVSAEKRAQIGMPASDGKDSRARSVSTADFHDDYGLIAFEYPSSQSFNQTMLPKVQNEQVLKSNGWMTKEYWPGSSYRLTFFTYAPYSGTINNKGSYFSLTDQTTHVGSPEFDFQPSTNALGQVDLLVCADDPNVVGNYNNIRNLDFKHALTCVQIAVGNQMAPCKITRIELQGIYGKGHYKYIDDSWNYVYGDKDGNPQPKMTYFLSQEFKINKTDHNRIINDGDNAFMCIPQTVPEGAILKIWIDDGQTHTLEADISGHIWERGCAITYYLSTGGTDGLYRITATTPSIVAPSADGSYSRTWVTSYYQTYYGSMNPVKWKAEIVLDGETTPSDVAKDYVYQTYCNSYGWGYMKGNGSTNNGEHIDFYLHNVSPVDTCPVTNTHTVTLRNRAAKSNVDLSASKGTANCYVVDAPGTYKFPLVYGNGAIGGTNYKDHLGQQITSANIYDTYDTHDAIIVWQDAPKLIKPSSVKLTGNSGGRFTTMEFEVTKDDICQGNAVLAVRDHSGVILWSWHIWVTDYDMSTTVGTNAAIQITNREGYSLKFAQKPLGWCDPSERVYRERKTEIRLRQVLEDGNTDTPGTCTVVIDQESDRIQYPLRANYYQWGRKDPMPGYHPSFTNYATQFYDNYDAVSGNTYTYEVHDAYYNNDEFWEAISHPNYFYYYRHNWWSNSSATLYNDLWNRDGLTELTNSKTKKTIYDPCPPGFCMPTSKAYTGFTRTGVNDGNAANWMKIGEFNGNSSENPPRPINGWKFSRTGDGTGYFTYFPAFGCRATANGSVANYNSYGYYYTAEARNYAYAYMLHFYGGCIWPIHDSEIITEACCVWPVVEE